MVNYRLIEKNFKNHMDAIHDVFPKHWQHTLSHMPAVQAMVGMGVRTNLMMFNLGWRLFTAGACQALALTTPEIIDEEMSAEWFAEALLKWWKTKHDKGTTIDLGDLPPDRGVGIPPESNN